MNLKGLGGAAEKKGQDRLPALPCLPSEARATDGERNVKIPARGDAPGEWHGSGRTARGKIFSLKLIIKEDGTYRTITKWSDGSNDNEGTRRLVHNGTVRFTSATNGQTVYVTLNEGEKGKGQLKARRPDGMTWQVGNRWRQ